MPPGPRIQARPAGGGGSQIASHVTTVGVRRPPPGQQGRAVKVFTNHFEVRTPSNIIHHYDAIQVEKNLPAKLNLDIIKELQESIPQVFTPKAVYDGRKNMFASKPLPFTNRDSKGQPSESFDVILPEDIRVFELAKKNGIKPRDPKAYKVRITKVAEINPEVLAGFLQGRQSHDNSVLTAITAMNVVIRMLPISKYPFNVRSFFTDREQKDIGGGLILWRGYFQSIRPGGNRMWINIDISTGTMYKDLNLIAMCLEHLNIRDPRQLTAQGGFTDRDRMKLQRFLAGVRVATLHTNTGGARAIKKITLHGASGLTFQTREGGSMTVQAYFENTYRKRLQYPQLPCVEVGAGALIPMEYCKVVPGQLMRKQVPADKTRDVLAFSTQKPGDRLTSIRNGINVFEYQTSEYMRAFGMEVKTSVGPLEVNARVLPPPSLMYGQRAVIRDKKFFKPANVAGWVMAIFDREQRFNQDSINNVVKSLRLAGSSVGMGGWDNTPFIPQYCNPQKPVSEQLGKLGSEFSKKYGKLPNLIVVILPENATDTYTAVKYFGDCAAGVATQCMKSNKCSRGTAQYFANICLKVNVKLDGVNCIPNPSDVRMLSDHPTMVFGADVVHPAPGSEGRPSFTALVGNIDVANSKYAAKVAVQESRVEMIQDLESMAVAILKMYQHYPALPGGPPPPPMTRQKPPQKAIFFRDGVSEGQFKQVLDEEVPRLKAAFASVGLVGPLTPRLTVIVVGKRHHVRFFPTNNSREQADNSGNCKAGTIIDRDVTHPTEFDYYLQSHAGLLGTSRPAHYNVLLDENNFQPDALQQLSFALCHVYARSTRSVSIPAPVYYADIVCARAKNHFDPSGSVDVDTLNSPETGSHGGRSGGIQSYRNAFKSIHSRLSTTMYFS
ncbi:hypothetical protein M422DRAFT_23034 [Sphaerobolus stellatus SS14]|nr:hypothetical protein M422DRAFT_23034 [Sphaerobolus stellatus SS14]